VQIYHILEQQRENLNPTPPRPYHAELGLPIRLARGASVSTTDEGTETPDDGSTTYSGSLSSSFISRIKETVQVEADGESDPVFVVRTKKTPRATFTPPRTKDTNPKDARIAAAEAWVAEYRSTRPGARAATPALRSYRIWHKNEDLKPAAIASLLRQPPLQTNTVVGYILEAIRLERLPFRKDRLLCEVLCHLPKEALDGRYKALVKMAQEPEAPAGRMKL